MCFKHEYILKPGNCLLFSFVACGNMSAFAGLCQVSLNPVTPAGGQSTLSNELLFGSRLTLKRHQIIERFRITFPDDKQPQMICTTC